jgi:hypothetical protein
MRKIAVLALAVGSTTACIDMNYSTEYGEEYDFSAYAPGPMEFARGEALQDASTIYGETKGFALGNDAMGAVGMIGMVCSFNAQDGLLRMDVDPDTGDELVVGAISTDVDGIGFETVAIDVGQVTITEFPTEWSGAVAVDVAVEDTPEDADLTHDHIVLLNTHEGACSVERLDRLTGEPVSTTELPGACTSELAIDPVTGRVFVSTFEGTFGIAVDQTVHDLGDSATLLSWQGDVDLLIKAEKGGPLLSAWSADGEAWSTTLDPDLRMVSVHGIVDGRLVAGASRWSDGAEVGGALVVLDAETGEVIEKVETSSAFRRIQVSPDGGMLAVKSAFGLHLVQVN